MNPLGGLFKLAAAGVLVWTWSHGYLTGAINATVAAFTTPRALKTPTFPIPPGGARGGQGF